MNLRAALTGREGPSPATSEENSGPSWMVLNTLNGTKTWPLLLFSRLLLASLRRKLVAQEAFPGSFTTLFAQRRLREGGQETVLKDLHLVFSQKSAGWLDVWRKVEASELSVGIKTRRKLPSTESKEKDGR
jgi:hypothetical protein